MKDWTIAEIKKTMIENGKHWWDKNTMRYFGTKVESKAYTGKKFVFFVTSERQLGLGHLYLVRCFDAKTLNITTKRKFHIMDRKAALQSARELAKSG